MWKNIAAVLLIFLPTMLLAQSNGTQTFSQYVAGLPKAQPGNNDLIPFVTATNTGYTTEATTPAMLSQAYFASLLAGNNTWTGLNNFTAGLDLNGSPAATTINSVQCLLGDSCTITATAASISPGTTTISPSVSGDILYDNAGVLGEKAVTGTGSVVLATSGDVSADNVTATGSTTARSLASRAAEVVNVLDYGAKCDGTTDDTAAIAAALTAANGKMPVVIPAAICNVSSALVPPQSSIIVGENWNASALNMTSTTADVFDINNSFVTISNLQITTFVTRSAGSYVNVGSGGGNFSMEQYVMSGAWNAVTISDGVSAVSFSKGQHFGSRSSNFQIGTGTGSGPTAVSLSDIIMNTLHAPTHIIVSNSGDVVMSNIQALGGSTNLLVNPGNGQVVVSLKVQDSFFDFATNDNFQAAPTGSGFFGRSNFDGVWFGDTATTQIDLNGGSASGGIDGITFTDCEAYVGTTAGLQLTGNVKNVSWIGGKIAQNGTGIVDNRSSGWNGFTVIGALIGNVGGFSANTLGVNLEGAGDYATITGNTITGNTTNFANTNSGTHNIVQFNAGVSSVLPVANGGTNCSIVSITCFNNITGFSAAGTTGNTSSNLVFSTSPSLTTPSLGVATGTSLALNGCTITGLDFCTTGAATLGGTLTTADGMTFASTGILNTNSYATSSTAAVNIVPTWNFSSTSNGISAVTLGATMVPTGASAGNDNALAINATAGTSAVNFSTLRGINFQFTEAAGYSGTISSGIGMEFRTPTISGTHPIGNFDSIAIDAISNGNGITTGSVTNTGEIITGPSAAAGSGGTVTNNTLVLSLPTGANAGTATNCGLCITGNGQTGGATNYAINSTSTAQSTLSGSLALQTLTASQPVYTDVNKNLTSTAPSGYSAVLSGTTGSIGGALLAGACDSGTVSVTNSTTAMSVVATPVTYPGDGFWWEGYVSTNGTVTVKVCASVAGTPTSSSYNVRVLQ